MATITTTTQNTADVFFSRVNPTTGDTEWIMQDQEYDYHQEVSRSAYADMLHDDERNKKYYAAIKEAVKIIQGRGKKAHVLDIGTGTGLLSMMAANSGAERVTACEAFHPMANVARKIIQNNGFADIITVIPKRSTDLTVGPDGDMPFKANILATEVFDTELIGEGAIPTYKHALENLLEDDCIAVPHSATIIVQAVESEKVSKWHKLQPIKLPNGNDIRPPADMETCPGAPSVHDFHLDELTCDQFQPITDPIEILHFPYRNGMVKEYGRNTIETKALRTGKAHAVFMWWTLQMDTKGEILLSMVPHWATSGNYDSVQWRDHWLQAAYYLPQSISVQKDDQVKVTGHHDEYSLWFDFQAENDKNPVSEERLICSSQASIVWSRQRIGMLNDSVRLQKYTSVLRQMIKNNSVVLSVSDGTLLPLMAAKLGAERVYTLERRGGLNKVIDLMVKENDLKDTVKVITKRPEDLTADDLDNHKVDILIGEPYFTNTLLPWHSLCFWYARTKCVDFLADNVIIMPGKATLKAIAVEFDHLWKIRAPVGTLEGFDVKPFDDLVQKSMSYSDREPEAHPLWEYPSRPLTREIDLMKFDFTKAVTQGTLTTAGNVTIQSSGVCHGVVIWMEFELDDNTTVSTGLLQQPVNFTDKLSWDTYTQQAVYFLPNNLTIDINSKQTKLDYTVTFDTKTGDMKFNFQLL
ncbi:protein arginine N-methyltransferase 7-like [Glandiceps talaboti]